MRRHALVPLLFLSGAAALVLEVAWFRRLAQVAGGTAVAMAAVLAAVIGGMALGSFLLGGRADRTRSPMRLYGVLELGIAAFALVTPFLIDVSESLFTALYRGLADQPTLLTAARFLLAVLLLALPAVFMGGSLPAAAAAARPRGADRGKGIGVLYASNTLGAVGGTLVAGFVLLPTIGLSGTMRGAAVLSGIAGGAALLLARSARTVDGTPARAEDLDVDRSAARRAIVLYAASGFLGLAAEVAFTRRLVLVFGSTTYAFSTMLAVFLLGIGLGSVIGSRLATAPGRHLGRLEITVGATAALFSLSMMVVYWLPRLYLTLYLAADQDPGTGFWIRAFLSAAVLLPGAIGLGIAFPLAVHLAAGARGTGEGTGRLYAANTLASVVGSTLAVFVLVPGLGPHLAVVVTALAVALIAASGSRRWVSCALVAVCAVGLIPVPDVWRERLVSGVYFAPHGYLRGGEIDETAWDEGVDVPFIAHGRNATVSLWRWYGKTSLMVDGKAVASDQVLADDHHLMLLGHLPMLTHPDPESVLVVGLGMGTTYRAVAMHEPSHVRVVEIEEVVVEAARRLGLEPAGVVVADARTWVKATDERYDVITSDPIHPWVRGGGDLYSLEYLEACRARLAPGGVMCQWLPVYQMGVDDVRDVARTFASVFRTAAYYGGGDLVLIGVAQGEVPAPRRFSVSGHRSVLEEDLGLLRVADHDRLVAVVGPGPLLTDDSLRLELSAPEHLASPELADAYSWIERLWQMPPAPYGELLRAQRALARGDWNALPDHIRRALDERPGHGFVKRFAGEVALSALGFAIKDGLVESAQSWLESARKHLGDDSRLLGAQADLHVLRGEKEQALQKFRALLEASPDSAYLRRKIAKLE